MKYLTTVYKRMSISLALVLGLSLSVFAQTVTDDFELIDPVWSVMPADVEFLYDFNDDGEPAYVNQGGTYNKNTGNILIPTVIDGDPQVAIIDSEDGSFIDYLPMTEDVGGGDVTLELIEVTATRDGRIFGINQVMEAAIRIYMWEDESSDPVVVYNEARNMPNAGQFGQWGQGFGVIGEGENLTALVSGFQNPNILVLEWNDGQFEFKDKFDMGSFGFGNGFGEIPGSSNTVWTNGAGIEASIVNFETGDVVASVDEGIINRDHYDIDYIETDMGSFIIAGPRYPDTPFSVVDVTDVDDAFLRHLVIFPADQAIENVQLTGFVHFTSSGNAVVMSSNNPLMYFALGIGSVDTSGEQLDLDLPASITLQQNYPNPFNPVTTISYTLDRAADVTVNVYSITGQKVASINAGMQNTGSHSLEFDASHLSSGSYIYQLQAGSQMLTRTMMLIK